jgi:hypothetical protein
MGEKLAKQQAQDHLRCAERDRLARRASQAAPSRPHRRDLRLRRLAWVARLVSALIGAV